MKFAVSEAFGVRGFWPTISFFFFAGISGFFLAADSLAAPFAGAGFLPASFAIFTALFAGFAAPLSGALGFAGAVFLAAGFAGVFFSGFAGAAFLATGFIGAAFFAFATGFAWALGLAFAADDFGAADARVFATALAAGLVRLEAALSFLGFADFAIVFSAVFVAITFSFGR